MQIVFRIYNLRNRQSTIDNRQSTIIPPPPEELSRLNAMTLIGDIMGIREGIEKIEALDPKFKPFAAEVRELAKALKVSEFQRFIRQYLEEQ